jgi:hypothetical protein
MLEMYWLNKKIRVLRLFPTFGNSKYINKVGIVKSVRDGMLYGTWGKFAVSPFSEIEILKGE